MKIEGVIWLNQIVDKLAFKHHVETYEVEEMLNEKPRFRFVEKGERKNEDVYMALGANRRRQIFDGFVRLQNDKRSLNTERKGYGWQGKKNVCPKIIKKNYPNSILSMR